MNIEEYIKPAYTFREINDLAKLPLEVKEKITCEVIRQATRHSRHNMAIAFSGGKDRSKSRTRKKRKKK